MNYFGDVVMLLVVFYSVMCLLIKLSDILFEAQYKYVIKRYARVQILKRKKIKIRSM